MHSHEVEGTEESSQVVEIAEESLNATETHSHTAKTIEEHLSTEVYYVLEESPYTTKIETQPEEEQETLNVKVPSSAVKRIPLPLPWRFNYKGFIYCTKGNDRRGYRIYYR